MAYKKWERDTVNFSLTGLKVNPRVIYGFRATDDFKIYLVVRQGITTREKEELMKIGFDNSPMPIKNFNNIYDAYNFILSLITKPAIPVFSEDFKKFIFKVFNLDNIADEFKNSINIFEQGIERKLLALQKLYKD